MCPSWVRSSTDLLRVPVVISQGSVGGGASITEIRVRSERGNLRRGSGERRKNRPGCWSDLDLNFETRRIARGVMVSILQQIKSRLTFQWTRNL
jgi:hypothetical protein